MGCCWGGVTWYLHLIYGVLMKQTLNILHIEDSEEDSELIRQLLATETDLNVILRGSKRGWKFLMLWKKFL